jgi:hypothetical protein
MSILKEKRIGKAKHILWPRYHMPHTRRERVVICAKEILPIQGDWHLRKLLSWFVLVCGNAATSD